MDVRLQARSRLYAIGLAMAVLSGLFVRVALPAAWLSQALPAVTLLGIGGTTYMFGGAMVLFERTQGTLEALRVSPIRTPVYLASKTLTLTGFALVETLVILLFGGGLGTLSLPLYLVGAAGLGAGLTLVGVGQVARHDSVTSFLMPGAAFITVIAQLPVFYILDVGPAAVWYCIPSQGPLLFMLGPGALATWPKLAYAILVTAGLVVGSALYARARFHRYVGLNP